MKNFLFLLLALPGWVAAQSDSAIHCIEIDAHAVPLTTVCANGNAALGCCAKHYQEKGIQVEPNWCHDHSHCIHQHQHRVSEENQAAACAEQCQHHGTYQLVVSNEAIRPLDRAVAWPQDPALLDSKLGMPFPFFVYGRQVKSLEMWDDNYLSLLDQNEKYLMDIVALDIDVAFVYSYTYEEQSITYQTDGQPGERIMKIQISGLRRFYKDSIVIQIWLHETNQAVSIHYLKMPVNKKDEHAEISLWADCPNGRHEMYIAGLASSPIVRCASQYMCGLPENGTVYTLKPLHLILPERKQMSMQLPSFELKVEPESGMHQLVGLVGSDELQLFDAQGRLVKRIEVEQARQGFVLNEFASGAYILHDPLYGQSVRLLKP